MQRDESLHVAVVADIFPKLSETFVLDHVTDLLDRGVRVTVLASPPSSDEPRHPDAVDLDVATIERPTVPTTPLRRMGVLLSAIGPIGPRRLLAAGLRSRRERIGTVRAIIEAAVVDGLPEDVDVIHCHFGPIGAAVLGAVRDAGRDVPVVTTFHGYDISTRSDLDRVYAGLFRDPRSLLLPVSARWRRHLVDAGADPERTIVHRLGIDLDLHDFAAPRRTDGPLRVLSVGRLVEKKGFLDAAEGVAAAVAQGHDLHWTIIGDGPQRTQLERRVERPDLRGRVHVAGRRTRDDVARAMREAHVLLAPSRTAANGDMEGIPVVLMEAMATGLPVVSTVHSGIPELVVEGSSGLLVPEGDVDGLAARLGQLDRDETLRQDLARGGRARVASLHDAETQMDTLVAHYRAVRAPSTPV